jgi:hypothetical protein
MELQRFNSYGVFQFIAPTELVVVGKNLLPAAP